MFKKVKSYFSEDLWNFPLKNEKGTRKFMLKWLRIPYLTIKGFVQNNCGMAVSSLTYYTLLSVVPLLAMTVAFARAIGLQEHFREELIVRFQEHALALNAIFAYADSFINEVKGGVFASLGVGALLITAVFLLSDFERILNQIWGVKKRRSLNRWITDYLILLLIVPILFVGANSLMVFISKYLEIIFHELSIGDPFIDPLLFSVRLIPYGLFWGLFSFVYFFVPNIKVRFGSACIGGLIAGSLYLIVQFFYVKFQIGVSNYGVVYGSMAALPLFLIWIQLSWFLILIGAEISCAHQTFAEHEFETKASRASYDYRRILSLWITHLAIKEGSITLLGLVYKFHVPFVLAESILGELVKSHVLLLDGDLYTPSAESFSLKISDLIQRIEGSGEENFPLLDQPALERFKQVYKSFYKLIKDSPENMKISCVSDSI